MSPKLGLELLEDRTVASSASAATAYGQLPLAFEANQGQFATPLDFQARGSDYTLGLTAQDARLNLAGGTALDVQLVGANPFAAASASGPLITKTNYFVGNNPGQWHTNIPNFSRVEYQNIYSGVNLVYYGNQGQLEYDFVVAPGADPNVVKLSIKGAQSIALDGQGNLLLHEAGGDVIEQAPVVYQDIGGAHQAVAGKFVLQGNDQVGFQFGAYDPSRPLVIDPTLSYSSYIGGASSAMFGIAVDSSDAAYLTGRVANTPYVAKLNAAGSALVYQTFLGTSAGEAQGYSIAVDTAGDAYVTGDPGANFPTTANAFSQSASKGFVTVLDPTGSGLIYSTFLPGVYQPYLSYGAGSGGIAIDSSGNAYVTGPAGAGFPTTASAYQSSLAASGSANAFLAEINPNLSGSASLVYSTYLGGNGTDGGSFTGDAGTGVALDNSGNVYVSGYTNSSNFPTTQGAYQRMNGGGSDVFVAKFNPALSGAASLLYSTYLGGGGNDGLNNGNVLVLPSGAGYSFYPTGLGIAVDNSGDACIAGGTQSTNFPTTSGAYVSTIGSGNGVAFVTKLNPTGTGLVYSTYLGTNSSKNNSQGWPVITRATSVAVDSAGNAYVAGWTRSGSFPTVNAIQSQQAGSGKKTPNAPADAFVTTLNAAGSGLLFSTYLGGTNEDWGMGIALDSAGNTYVAGVTTSSNYPTTAGAYQTTFTTGGYGFNGFVAKIDPPAEGATAATRATTTTVTGVAILAELVVPVLPLEAGRALANAPASLSVNLTANGQGSLAASDSVVSAMLPPIGTILAPVYQGGALSGGVAEAVDQVFMEWRLDGWTGVPSQYP
jgi:hypothetical protein